jgi:hypothetical protein
VGEKLSYRGGDAVLGQKRLAVGIAAGLHGPQLDPGPFVHLRRPAAAKIAQKKTKKNSVSRRLFPLAFFYYYFILIFDSEEQCNLTKERCTPRLRCVPEHVRQMKMPAQGPRVEKNNEKKRETK